MRGGKREGAGRRSGTPNKATRERAEQIAATGETPLDYMLRVMRDDNTEAGRRDEMAKASAPYVHAKFSTIEHTGKDGGPLRVEVIKFGDNSHTS